MQWEEANSLLPGGLVRMRVRSTKHPEKGDCFSACISMLTGIDLDLLPVMPPTTWIKLYSEGIRQYLHVLSADYHADDKVNREWIKLLAHNGFVLDVVSTQPKTFPHIAILHVEDKNSHAVIHLTEDVWIDPWDAYPETSPHNLMELLYWTVTPM